LANSWLVTGEGKRTGRIDGVPRAGRDGECSACGGFGWIGAGTERDQEADKAKARDDFLGGIPSAAIAGLFQTCTIKGKTTTSAKVLSVQNRTVAKH